MSASSHSGRATGLFVRAGESAGPAGVVVVKSKEHTPKFRLGSAGPLLSPVDHAHAAIAGGQDAVGPEIPVAGLQRLGWLEIDDSNRQRLE